MKNELQKIIESCNVNKIKKMNSNELIFLLGSINQKLKSIKNEITTTN